MLADARAAFDRIAALPLDEVTAANVLDQWDAIAIALENIDGPIAILNNVHPDKSVRDAADAAVRSLSSFQVEIFQNEALYRRVQAVSPTTPAGRGSGRISSSRSRTLASRCRPIAARAPRRSPISSPRSPRSSRATCATTRRA